MRVADRRRVIAALAVAVAATVLCAVADLPRVTGLPPRVYLARGLTGRINCPVDANPPVTIILWAKDKVMIGDDDDSVRPALSGGGGGRRRRLRTSRQGTLFIRPVEKTDEGRYECTPYSPLGKGQTSMPVHVFVRGQSTHFLSPPLILRAPAAERTKTVYSCVIFLILSQISWPTVNQICRNFVPHNTAIS